MHPSKQGAPNSLLHECCEDDGGTGQFEGLFKINKDGVCLAFRHTGEEGGKTLSGACALCVGEDMVMEGPYRPAQALEDEAFECLPHTAEQRDGSVGARVSWFGDRDNVGLFPSRGNFAGPPRHVVKVEEGLVCCRTGFRNMEYVMVSSPGAVSRAM